MKRICFLAVLCAVLILFRLGSPVKVNGDAIL